MAKVCQLTEENDNLIELKLLTEKLSMRPKMDYHDGGAEWVEVKTIKGTAMMRGLKKDEHCAVTDNYASAGCEFPRHSHSGKEYFCVYVGEMLLNLNGNQHVVNRTKPFYFKANTPHSAIFEKETRYIAMTMPPDEGWPEGG